MNERRIAALMAALTDYFAGHRQARARLVVHFNSATEAEVFAWTDEVRATFEPGSIEHRRFAVIYDRLSRQYESRFEPTEGSWF